MTNGERLAFYRKKNAMTQQQLGEKLNVSAQAVSKWENDQSEPDIATLCKLAEIYQISVNELVGLAAPAPAATVVQKEAKKPNPLLKFLKKFWWVLALVAIIVVAIIVAVNVWDALEPNRILKKFDQIELGMTKEEVQAIMGEPEEIAGEFETEKKDSTGSVTLGDKYLHWLKYGYLEYDYEYWYYRDAQYEKTLMASKKAEKKLDLFYEPEPWTQVRFVFDGDGVLIEAYYNAAFENDYTTAYGESEKKCEEVVALDKMPTYYNMAQENSVYRFAIYYTDGSVLMGEFPIIKQGGTGAGNITLETIWGDAYYYLPTMPVGTHLPEKE